MTRANLNARQRLGQEGEEQAADYLLELGFRLLERNLRLPGGEIDLLMADRGTIVLVEVKTIRTNLLTSPLELITPKKQQTLQRLLRQLSARYPGQALRIDIVGLNQFTNPSTLIHLENALEVTDF